MDCKTCNIKGKEQIFQTFSFWLCPNCKQEIKSEPKYIPLPIDDSALLGFQKALKREIERSLSLKKEYYR